MHNYYSGPASIGVKGGYNLSSMYGAMGITKLHFIDYTVFGGMLALSAAIGVYFGYWRKTTLNTTNISQMPSFTSRTMGTDFGSSSMNEYLLGSRKMKSFPVAMSLVASYISGVTMLGTPAEIYNFGTQYWLIAFSVFFMGIAISHIYVPVFSVLQVGSSYEYLELRFCPLIRTFASIMFVLDEILFLPIIIYVPAIAFNQVTGLNLYMVGGIICVVCVFYTIIGGIKAVVATDAWQISIMFLSAVVIAILGTIALDGPIKVFERANEGGRISFFNFSPSLYERHTFWGVTIGGFIYWTSFNAVNQTMVQRYMSLPSLRKIRRSVLIFVMGVISFVSVCCYSGLLVYAAYSDCDPLTSGLVKADDQLLPVYVMQTVGHLPGIPGLFIAGVFGAALSSLSVVLNSTAAVIFEDIFKGLFKVELSERGAAFLVKGSILILGIMSMALLVVVEKLGGVLVVATSLSAIAAGTTFGMFTLGMLVPWCNNKGVIAGAICGAFISGWISFGTQYALATGLVTPHKLPASTDGCQTNITEEARYSLLRNYPDESDVFPLYRLSFHWISPIGVSTVIIIGTIVSFLTGPNDLKKINPKLISPIIHRFLPKECFDESIRRRERQAATLAYLLSEAPGAKGKVNKNPSPPAS